MLSAPPDQFASTRVSEAVCTCLEAIAVDQAGNHGAEDPVFVLDKVFELTADALAQALNSRQYT